MVVSSRKMDDDMVLRICDLLAAGVGRKAACERVGVHPSTLVRYRNANPWVVTAMQEAEAEMLTGARRTMKELAEAGDVAAFRALSSDVDRGQRADPKPAPPTQLHTVEIRELSPSEKAREILELQQSEDGTYELPEEEQP